MTNGTPRSPLGYAAAVAALEARGRFSTRAGIGRARALLREVGDPQLGFRGALVAGTNGKGSVIALAGAALRAAGVHVAETAKPHLVSYRERIAVDGEPIDAVAFARLAAAVLPAADRVERRHGSPTEFELLTAMAFRWLAERAVRVALVEVGLGGRLDPTHAWDGGVAVVTTIALDHVAQLGGAIPGIAREKAAIIERGDLAVTGADGPALSVIRRRAERLRAPLRIVAPPPVLELDRDGLLVDLPTLGPTRIGLRGRHQALNVAIADATLDALAEAGIAAVPAAVRRSAYATASWPGRLELLRVEGRDVLLDGAHNPAGAAALATALDDLRPMLTGGAERPPAPITLVVASMADKDVDGVIRALADARSVEGARVVATSVGLERALPAETLAARWRALAPSLAVAAVADPGEAFAAALGTCDGPVVVAGSLYLVGAVRGRIVDDPRLHDPEDGPA